MYTGNAYNKTLQMAAAYDGDGNRVYQLNYNPEKDEDFSDYYCSYQNCDYNGTGIQLQASGEVSQAEKELMALIGASGAVRNSSYELIEYVNDVNREYTEVLVEQNINGRIDTVYTYGNERISREMFQQTNRTSYYLYDPRGSVSGLTDAKAHLTQTYRYSANGELTYGGAKYENEYTYNGENYNPNIRSQHLRARYYNVTSARFLMEDSYLGDIAEPLTLNRYNYCISSWLNYVDPSGHVMRELTEVFFDYSQARWDYGKSKFLGYCSAVLTAGLNLAKPIGISTALLSGNLEIVTSVLDFYEEAEETAISGMAELAENKTAFYIGRCEGDITIILISEAAAADGISGVLTGGGTLVAEGVSGVGSVLIPETVVYTVAKVGEAAMGVEFALTTAKTLGKDLVKLSQAQKQQERGISHQDTARSESVKRNYDKVDDAYLKRKGIDAHRLKKDYLGEKAPIAHYDIYVDKNTGELFIFEKRGKEQEFQQGNS